MNPIQKSIQTEREEIARELRLVQAMERIADALETIVEQGVTTHVES